MKAVAMCWLLCSREIRSVSKDRVRISPAQRSQPGGFQNSNPILLSAYISTLTCARKPSYDLCRRSVDGKSGLCTLLTSP